MLTRFETRILNHLGAPQWVDTKANRITVMRTRIAVVGSQVTYWTSVLLGGLASLRYLLFLTLAFIACGAAADYFDGKEARRSGVSDFGKFCDPVADKFIAGSGYLIILTYFAFPWQLLAPVLANLAYDYKVMAVRRTDAGMGANGFAKWKQLFVFVALGLLISAIIDIEVTMLDTDYRLLWLGIVIFWSSLALLSMSALTYYAWSKKMSVSGWIGSRWVAVKLSMPHWCTFV